MSNKELLEKNRGLRVDLDLYQSEVLRLRGMCHDTQHILRERERSIHVEYCPMCLCKQRLSVADIALPWAQVDRRTLGTFLKEDFTYDPNYLTKVAEAAQGQIPEGQGDGQRETAAEGT